MRPTWESICCVMLYGLCHMYVQLWILFSFTALILLRLFDIFLSFFTLSVHLLYDSTSFEIHTLHVTV